jgi:hypothetical protein
LTSARFRRAGQDRRDRARSVARGGVCRVGHGSLLIRPPGVNRGLGRLVLSGVTPAEVTTARQAGGCGKSAWPCSLLRLVECRSAVVRSGVGLSRLFPDSKWVVPLFGGTVALAFVRLRFLAVALVGAAALSAWWAAVGGLLRLTAFRAATRSGSLDRLRGRYAARSLAAGFVLKDAGRQDLIHAVRVGAHGYTVLSPPGVRGLVDRYVTAGADRATEAGRASALTTRERDMLVIIGLGVSHAEAGNRLYLGECTVKRTGCTSSPSTGAPIASRSRSLPQGRRSPAGGLSPRSALVAHPLIGSARASFRSDAHGPPPLGDRVATVQVHAVCPIRPSRTGSSF